MITDEARTLKLFNTQLKCLKLSLWIDYCVLVFEDFPQINVEWFWCFLYLLSPKTQTK